MYRMIFAAVAGAMLLWFASSQAGGLDGIYGPTPLTVQSAMPPFPTTGIADRRRPRSFPEQPPTTPHSIYDDYKFSLADNRCLLCHNFSVPAGTTEVTHAPRVSPSHLVLRDGKIASEITHTQADAGEHGDDGETRGARAPMQLPPALGSDGSILDRLWITAAPVRGGACLGIFACARPDAQGRSR